MGQDLKDRGLRQRSPLHQGQQRGRARVLDTRHPAELSVRLFGCRRQSAGLFVFGGDQPRAVRGDPV